MKERYGFIKETDARVNFDAICENIRKEYNIKELHFLKQVHGDNILIDCSGTGDGIIITKPATGALIKTADCFPVVLTDRVKNISGIFHSGWKGTELGISAKGAEMMREIGCGNIEAVIFPGIEQCCFRIGSELIDRFAKANIPVIKKTDGYFADLKSAIISGLKSKGVETIKDMSVCTCCGEGYFSYRKDGTDKRHASFVITFS
ncbi:MAG TPA: polyphenol oxidase family protein [bacterium]|nr:polyphenol oxidase family protein [bacterium]HPS28635.1 polyphenol oxidase family protein [bacterium]